MDTTESQMKERGYMQYYEYIALAKKFETLDELFDKIGWVCSEIEYYDQKFPKASFFTQENEKEINVFLKNSGVKGVVILKVWQDELSVNEVLDKIIQHGKESLNVRERRFLDALEYYA